MPQAIASLLLHRWARGARWGEPRLTRDVDLTVIAGFGTEETVVDALLDGLTARMDDARTFARCRARPAE